jgi:hypothetical protein
VVVVGCDAGNIAGISRNDRRLTCNWCLKGLLSVLDLKILKTYLGVHVVVGSSVDVVRGPLEELFFGN